MERQGYRDTVEHKLAVMALRNPDLAEKIFGMESALQRLGISFFNGNQPLLPALKEAMSGSLDSRTATFIENIPRDHTLASDGNLLAIEGLITSQSINSATLLADQREYRQQAIHDLLYNANRGDVSSAESNKILLKASDVIQEIEMIMVGRRSPASTNTKKSMLLTVEELCDQDEGLRTGLRNIDQYMDNGIDRGEYIILGARPSIGKTALAITIAANMAKAGHNVLYVTMEMGEKQLNMRILSVYSQIPLSQIARMRHSREIQENVSQWTEQYQAMPGNIFVEAVPGRFSEVMQTVRRHAASDHAVDLVILDHIGKIGDDASATNRNAELGVISRRIHSTARELMIPHLVLSQLSRAPERSSDDKRPKSHHLRDSGNLEQDADQVWLLYRNREENEHLADLNIDKNRNGVTGMASLYFNTETTMFTDVDDLHCEA
jgi:replicative DNA helicase